MTIFYNIIYFYLVKLFKMEEKMNIKVHVKKGTLLRFKYSMIEFFFFKLSLNLISKITGCSLFN